MPPLIDLHTNTAHYTDYDKAEAIAKYFVNVHNLAHRRSSLLDDEIRMQSHTTSETDAHPPHHINITFPSPPPLNSQPNQKTTQQQSSWARQNHGNIAKKEPLQNGNSTDLLHIQKMHSKFLFLPRLENIENPPNT